MVSPELATPRQELGMVSPELACPRNSHQGNVGSPFRLLVCKEALLAAVLSSARKELTPVKPLKLLGCVAVNGCASTSWFQLYQPVPLD